VAVTEKRKYPRIKIFCLISYESVDEDGVILGQSYGTALDITQGGLLLETTSVVNSDYIMLSIIDLKEKVQELKAKVVYCKKTDTGRYRTGIRFQGTKEDNIQFISAIVRSYHSQKK
jgi:hypothetical protein